MEIIDLKEGEFCIRPDWSSSKGFQFICVGKVNGKLGYYDRGIYISTVRESSTSYDYNNFRLCNKEGRVYNGD